MRTVRARFALRTALLTLTLIVPRVTSAQNTGTFAGTVVDNQNQVISGATVLLINERAAGSRSTTSGPRGEFAFQAVPPGSYTVRIELTGFRTLERRSNVLNANGRLDLGAMRLDVGTLSEVVSVVVEGTTVETKNSDYSGLLTVTRISQVQTKGRNRRLAPSRTSIAPPASIGREPDQSELRHGDQDLQSDSPAQSDPDVVEAEFLIRVIGGDGDHGTS